MTGIEETAALGATAAVAGSAGQTALLATATSTLAGLGSTAAGAGGAAVAGGLASTIASAAPYLSAASGLISAVGSIAGGNAQADALKRNAIVNQTNAGTVLSSTEAEAARLQDRSRRNVAMASNMYGGSGVDENSGSPLDVLSDHAAQGALDSEITRWRGQTQSGAYLTNAGNLTAQAGSTQLAGDINAGSTLLTSPTRVIASQFPRNYAGL